MKYAPAASAIAELIEKKLKEPAIRALANIADDNSHSIIRKAAIENGGIYPELYLQYAQNLAAKGNKNGTAHCRFLSHRR